mmetsp:Transcript_10013/g.14444  ORF Transcript_10013/g.14444 Transcript_10013/m.14444 type:complete len:186 (-) Transcript_10013:107-664(-)
MRELNNYKSAPKDYKSAPKAITKLLVKYSATRTNTPASNNSVRSTSARRLEATVRAIDHEPLSPMAAFADIVIEYERSGRIDGIIPMQAPISPSRSPEEKVQEELLFIQAITKNILREAQRVIANDNAMAGVVPAHLIAYDATVLKILKRHALRRGIPFWIPINDILAKNTGYNKHMQSLGVTWI